MNSKRLLAAAGMGLACGLLGHLWRWQASGYEEVGDLYWAFSTAQDVLEGRDPYAFEPSGYRIPYPLPVAVFGLPLVWLPWPAASSVLIGLSCGLLAYLCTQDGTWWRLWVFASAPLVGAVFYGQWMPLILAAAFAPALAPLLVLVKPQVALPIAARRLSRRGLAVAGVVLLSSLAYDPSWPLRWLGKIGQYQSLIPALTLPFGPLLLGALWYWRRPEGRMLALMAVLPIRSLYDAGALWLVPQTRRQTLLLSLLSWLALLTVTGVGRGHANIVPALFIPALVMLWLNQQASRPRS